MSALLMKIGAFVLAVVVGAAAVVAVTSDADDAAEPSSEVASEKGGAEPGAAGPGGQESPPPEAGQAETYLPPAGPVALAELPLETTPDGAVLLDGVELSADRVDAALDPALVLPADEAQTRVATAAPAAAGSPGGDGLVAERTPTPPVDWSTCLWDDPPTIPWFGVAPLSADAVAQWIAWPSSSDLVKATLIWGDGTYQVVGPDAGTSYHRHDPTLVADYGAVLIVQDEAGQCAHRLFEYSIDPLYTIETGDYYVSVDTADMCDVFGNADIEFDWRWYDPLRDPNPRGSAEFELGPWEWSLERPVGEVGRQVAGSAHTFNRVRLSGQQGDGIGAVGYSFHVAESDLIFESAWPPKVLVAPPFDPLVAEDVVQHVWDDDCPISVSFPYSSTLYTLADHQAGR